MLARAELNGFVQTPERPTIFGHAARYDHDLPAIVAWLAKPQLRAAIDAEIDAQSCDAEALTDAERSKLVSSLLGRILECERAEVSLIELSNGQVLWRHDLDPRAVLQVVGPPPRHDL